MDFQATPYGQKGGLNAFPVSGIVSGGAVALGNSGLGFNDTTKSSIEVTITTGQARFDGVLCTLPATGTVIIPTPTADLSAVGIDVTYKIFLNPRRVVPALTSGTPSSPATDDQYLSVLQVNDANYGSYQVVQAMLKYNGSTWVPLDPTKDIKNSYGWNNMVFMDVNPTLLAANYSITNELPIFQGSNRPPHLHRCALPMVRQSAGIELATIRYTGGTGAIVKGLPEYHRLFT